MKTKTVKFVVMSVIVSGLLILPFVGHAGSLEPSAPPGPTMKTPTSNSVALRVWRRR